MHIERRFCDVQIKWFKNIFNFVDFYFLLCKIPIFLAAKLVPNQNICFPKYWADHPTFTYFFCLFIAYFSEIKNTKNPILADYTISLKGILFVTLFLAQFSKDILVVVFFFGLFVKNFGGVKNLMKTMTCVDVLP